MKRLPLLLLLLVSNIASFAQAEKDAISFLEKIIRNTQTDGQIIYTDKINKNVLEKVRNGLDKRLITGVTAETENNSIELTKQEKKYILTELENSTYPYWNENLFNDSKLIREENSTAYIKKVFQEYSENLNNPTSSTSDRLALIKNYSAPNVFEFSMPVYLRDNTVCFVFMSYLCGNPCGFDELCFYKKENNVWKKWVVVNSDVF
jgi:hypothetical protein